MKSRKKHLAAIDIGTNSFHLIIAETEGSSGLFKVLDREKEIVRLGSGSTDMKYMSERAISRGVQTLKRFKQIADSFGAKTRAIATSAVREALNQEEFIRQVRAETGFKVEVASGLEEARLIYMGVIQALPVFNKKILMIDIGGGSTEFLVAKRRAISFSNSLKLGAVRLTQRFFRQHEADGKSVKECRNYVRGMLQPVVRDLANQTPDLVVGSSGTIVNLASIIRRESDDHAETPLNNFTFQRDELFEAVERILECDSAEERASIPGLDPSRADIIVAGAIILEQVFRSLKIQSLTVSEFALREGILLDTIEKEHTKRSAQHLGDIRMNSVTHVAEQFHYERRHARHVAKLALKIFDRTQAMHGMGEAERDYLEAAALLHEVGLFVSHGQHHRHSYYLIRNSEVLGFTENEKEIIANVARYHRKSHPKIKHEGFRNLLPEDQETVTKLAAILRIADGLDRTHSSAVRDVGVRKRGDSVTLLLKRAKRNALELEIWGAERKKQLFEELFDAKVHFKPA